MLLVFFASFPKKWDATTVSNEAKYREDWAVEGWIRGAIECQSYLVEDNWGERARDGGIEEICTQCLTLVSIFDCVLEHGKIGRVPEARNKNFRG